MSLPSPGSLASHAAARRVWFAAVALVVAAAAPPHLPPDMARRMAVAAMSHAAASLAVLVTLASIWIRHELSLSDLMLNFCVSAISGTVVFIAVLGAALSSGESEEASYQDSRDALRSTWRQHAARRAAAQLLWTPVLCLVEVAACLRAAVTAVMEPALLL